MTLPPGSSPSAARERRVVNVADLPIGLPIGGTHPLVLIAGPCVIESAAHAMEMALGIREVARSRGVPVVFKASYDKANRTSVDGYRGPGLNDGLEILARVREEAGLPVLSDVHAPAEVEPAAEVLDVLQIPAFLCRQTDLILAAAASGRPVNIKKGQFLAPWDMAHVVGKAERGGARGVLLTERGVSFGYNTLVNDMRALVQLRATGWPVVFDGTHSVQQPGGLGAATGGDRAMVPVLCRAAVAVGVDALFLEVHDRPEKAKSDGSNQLRLEDLGALLDTLTEIDALTRRFRAQI